jgi:hypothetical protein
VLHGAETLQPIIEIGVRLDTLVIRGVERRRFEGSDLPEICEAARMVWLDTRSDSIHMKQRADDRSCGMT